MANVSRSHPSSAELRAWASGRADALTAHIHDCDRCQGDLETLTDLQAGLRDALQSVTMPDPGMVPRIEARLERRRRDVETWSVVADLFGLGWRTLDALRPPDSRDG